MGAAGSPYAGHAAICYCRQVSPESASALAAAGWFERAQAVRYDRLIPVLEAGVSGQTASFTEPVTASERVSQRLARRIETTPAQASAILDDIHSALNAAWQAGVDLVIAPDTIRMLDNGRAQVSLALSMCLNPRPGSGSEGAAQFQLAILTALLLSGQGDPAHLCIDKLRGPDKSLAISLVRERMGNLAEFVAFVIVKALDGDPNQRYPTVSAFLAAYKESLKATADNLAFVALEAKSREGEAMASIYGQLIKRYDEQHQEIAVVGARLAQPSPPPSIPPNPLNTPLATPLTPGVPPFTGAEPPLSPEIAALLAGPAYQAKKPKSNPWLSFAGGLLVICIVFLVLAIFAMSRT